MLSETTKGKEPCVSHKIVDRSICPNWSHWSHWSKWSYDLCQTDKIKV